MNKDLLKIGEYYGVENQKLKLVEECAELIQAIMKKDRVHIAEEMADVSILIRQLLLLDDSFKNTVEQYVNFKIERQLQRIDDEQEDNFLKGHWVFNGKLHD